MRFYKLLPPIGVACGLIAAFALRSSRTVYIGGPTIVIDTHAGQMPARRPIIEMAFVLDTTGSMGGLIDAAKQKVWCIINNVMRSPCHPMVRVGLVAYRDHGDVYVTKVLPMTDDLDSVYSTLMQYQAEGGGDTPEDVRQAMTDAVHKVGWSHPAAGMAQFMFLVGDAPPHDDYANEPDCLTSAAEAVQRGIVVNAIECGSAPDTKVAWQKIANRGQGKFMAIAENGGVQAITTPYDDDLARLGSSIDGSYMAYGGGGLGGGVEAARAFRGGKMAKEAAVTSHISVGAAPIVMADRAVNKAINSDAYEADLVQDVENGKVNIDTVNKADLPDNLQKLPAAELKADVSRRVAERKALKDKILELSKKRDAFIAENKRKLPGGGDGFDAVVTAAIKQEAESKGVKL